MAVVRAGSFDGTTSKMTIANYTGNPTSFSVAVWVYLNANQVQRVFFENYQATGPKGWAVGIHDTVNNKLKFYLSPNTLNSTTALSLTTWTFVVFTYDGTTAKIYLNGSSTPDATLVTALSYGAVPANNGIGALSSGSQFLNGKLAAPGYWSKVLTSTEITNLYNLGLGVNYSELTGSLLTSLGSYHDFNIITDMGHDSSTNARNYTATNVSRSPISTIPYATAVVADSPVSYWKTDETVSSTIHDSVDSNDLQQINPSTLNQTGPGTLKAIDFTPGGWLVPTTLHTLNLQITGNITLEAWAKLTSAPVTGARSIILDRGYTSNTYPFDNYCLFAEDSSGCFGIGITVGTTLYEAAGTSPPIAGVWYHLCGTYDGTNLRFYQNGVLQSTTAVSGAIRNDDSALTIASANRPTLLSNQFFGSISNIAIYNTALSSTRVAAHFATVVNPNLLVSQVGVLVVDTANPNIRVSQVGVLIVDQGTPNVRLSWFGLATIYTANPNVRVSQSGILSIYTVTPKARDSQIGALVVVTGSPKVRDSQIGALVVVVTSSAARISQIGTLVVYQGTPKARISQAGTLVVYTIAPYLDYTFTTPTTAIGAGTPSRAITIRLTGFNLTLGSTASFALSDGGVGGVFFPASPVTIASGNGPGAVTQFVYTAPIGTTGTVTLTATCTGGLTSTKTLSLAIGTATVFIRDALTDTSGTALDAHTPDIGGAWTRQPNAATARYSLNGVGGIYQPVAVAAGNYSSYLNATQAATTEYDIQADWVVKDNTFITGPLLIANGISGVNLSFYTFMAYNKVAGQGWYMHKMTNGAATLVWGPVNSPTVTPGTYTGVVAIRTINGNQYLFHYANNSLLHAPQLDNTYNSKNVGFCTNTETTSAQTPTIGTQVSNFYARNTDWSVSTPTPTPTANASCMLMGM